MDGLLGFTAYTANPFPVMTTRISLCTNSHMEIPVMNTGSLQWEQGFPVMKTDFSLWELVHRENPVLALFWHCSGTVRDCSVGNLYLSMTNTPYFVKQIIYAPICRETIWKILSIFHREKKLEKFPFINAGTYLFLLCSRNFFRHWYIGRSPRGPN